MKTLNLLLMAAAAATTASLASAQGDMVVHRIGGSGSGSNFTYYGQNSGIAAYSVSSQSCNIGNQNLIWTSGNGQTHPVISQNIFRLKDDRFEQLGQSWLKHGFCALCEGGCGNGQGQGCANMLFVGCADTYSDGLNDGQNGGPKFTVDPVSGDHQHPDPTPTGNSTIRGRLQVPVADVTPGSNVGAEYILEGMYVHYQDHQNGNAANNATWREISFTNGLQIAGTNESASPNNVGETAVHGWKGLDNNVQIAAVVNANEGGSGINGYYDVGSRVHDNGDGTYDYVYMVYNLNSTQGADSFSIPFGGANLTDVWFSDVDYHSGEPQDGTDWTMATTANAVVFSCTQTFAQNPNANAINWATGYSFGFTADAAPSSGVGEITMFEPGVGNVLTFPLDGPGVGQPAPGAAYCFGDGTGAACPCNNTGSAGAGCFNSSLVGATLSASGVASFSGDTFSLSVSGVAGAKPGLVLRGNNQVAIPSGDGILCAAGGSQRSQVQITSGGATTFTNFNGAGFGSVANMGSATNFQFWYRDPQNSPCGTGFNFSNGWTVTYQP